MAERELTAVSDQDVEAHDRDRKDQSLGPLASLEAVDDGRQSDEEKHRHCNKPV